MTWLYMSTAKIRVTLTLMPSLMSCSMAGMPAGVAGILIIRLGLSISFHSLRACSMLPWVSLASSGQTSMEM